MANSVIPVASIASTVVSLASAPVVDDNNVLVVDVLVVIIVIEIADNLKGTGSPVVGSAIGSVGTGGGTVAVVGVFVVTVVIVEDFKLPGKLTTPAVSGELTVSHGAATLTSTS